MKTPSKNLSRVWISLLAAAACIASVTSVHAQQYYYWNNGFGSLNDQYGVLQWSQAGGGGNPWANNNGQFQSWADGNFAIFQGTGGTVNVTQPVSANELLFQNLAAGQTYTFEGSTITTTGEPALDNFSSANVTINNNLVFDTQGSGDRINVADEGSNNTITLGPISVIDSVPSAGATYRSIIFDPNGANDTFVLNGVNTSGTSKAINLRFGEGNSDTGTYILKGDYTTMNGGDFIELPQGTVILDTSATPTGKGIVTYNGGSSTTNTHAILTQGAQTITNNINAQNRNDGAAMFGVVTVGGSDNSNSTFSGQVNADFTDLHVTAAAGGRTNFTGQITGDTADGLVKTGAGTVVLANANTYGIYNYYTSTNGTVAADLQAGKTLITNTGGSAFGNNTGVVKVESGATLGGSGISTELVSLAGGAKLAPGDSGADLGTPTVATLHLTGGLAAADGATLSFKLAADGASNDMIDLAAGALTLNGTTNLTFTALGTVNTWSPTTGNYFYTLATGTGTWSSTANFNVTAPNGYLVDHLVYNAGSNTFEIEFKDVPEPSTYALMIGGLAFLALCMRRKKQTM
jgi:fibronectin-binding autotransporter adhesin